METSRAFELYGVEKAFGDFTLRADRLLLDRGYVMGLIGANGAGKSTLIKILLNLIHPDRGRVRLLGLDQPRHEIAIKRRVGYVSELPGFYPEMTVGWTLRFVSRHYPTWNHERERELLTKFGLNPKKAVKELSRGMQVKLALTLALAFEPDLLILDEPTSGLDPLARGEFLQEMLDVVRDERRSVLFSSHITQDVEKVADYVAMIKAGQIVEHSEKDGLMARWKRVSGAIPDGDVALFKPVLLLSARRKALSRSDRSVLA